MLNLTHVVIGATGLLVLVISLMPIPRIIDSPKLSLGQKVYWAIVVVVFPVLGAIAWLIAGKQKA